MTNHPEAALRALEESRTYVLANFKVACQLENDNEHEARLIRLIDKGLSALHQIEAAPSLPDSSPLLDEFDSILETIACNDPRLSLRAHKLREPLRKALSVPPSSPQLAELVASIEHYFKNYMLDEADDDHVCNTDAQHNAAVRVRDAIDAISAPQSAPKAAEPQWQTIETAPKDRTIVVCAPAYQDLPPLASLCKWHEDAGFCIDELRQAEWWTETPRSLAQAEQAAKEEK